MERYKEIERSIIKKFRPAIWSKFMRAIKDYNLDVCCCNIKIVSEDGSIKDEYCTPSGIISGNEILVCYIAKNYFFW